MAIEQEERPSERSVPNIAGALDEAVDDAYDELGTVRDALGELGDLLKSQGIDFLSDVEYLITKKPARAVGMAFLAGMTVGLLLRGRTRR